MNGEYSRGECIASEFETLLTTFSDSGRSREHHVGAPSAEAMFSFDADKLPELARR